MAQRWRVLVSTVFTSLPSILTREPLRQHPKHQEPKLRHRSTETDSQRTSIGLCFILRLRPALLIHHPRPTQVSASDHGRPRSRPIPSPICHKPSEAAVLLTFRPTDCESADDLILTSLGYANLVRTGAAAQPRKPGACQPQAETPPSLPHSDDEGLSGGAAPATACQESVALARATTTLPQLGHRRTNPLSRDRCKSLNATVPGGSGRAGMRPPAQIDRASILGRSRSTVDDWPQFRCCPSSSRRSHYRRHRCHRGRSRTGAASRHPC